jgi:branched-chain amino acid aminotransferase/para-aminobenzoate synthetase component 1
MAAEFVWLNNELLPLGEARVSVLDRGFLYGDGLFETLRAESGRVQFLGEHLARLQASARAFRLPFPEGVDWEGRLGRLLAANGLGGVPAAVKILLTRGEAPELGLPESPAPTLVIYARPYTPPGPGEYAAGWPVAIFPAGRSTFVGRHKSLNYLFYLAARQYALDRGCREALVLEADGLVSEGAATSLVYLKGRNYYTPAAVSALPGVTLAVLSRALARQGRVLTPEPTTPAQLRAAQGLWLANSLLGLMPVSHLDGEKLPLALEHTHYLQSCLAAQGERESAGGED